MSATHNHGNSSQILLYMSSRGTRGSEWNCLIFQDLSLESLFTLKLSLNISFKVCPSESLYLIFLELKIFYIVFDVIVRLMNFELQACGVCSAVELI